MKYIWKNSKGQYSNGETLYIKNFPCGEYSWDSCRPKNSDIPPYQISSSFKLNIKTSHFNTVEEAKEVLEELTTQFINYLIKE